MKEVLLYVLGVIACSALLVTFYRTMLHGRVSFAVARAFLLASPLLAAVIPALEIPVWQSAPVEIPIYTAPSPLIVAPMTSAPPVDWLNVAFWSFYIVGIVVLSAIMVRQVIKIGRIRRRAKLEGGIRTIDGNTIVTTNESTAPFSFLSTIYVSCDTPSEELFQIVIHEGSHVRHRHSLEKIAMETFKTLLWFSPAVWWASRLLDEVHEFQADSDTLAAGCPIEKYLPTIFRQIFGVIPEISTGLGNSLTKKRFKMMKTNLKHKKLGWLRAAGVLPLTAGMLALFSFTHRAPEIVYVEAPEVVEAESAITEKLEAALAEVRQERTKVAETQAEITKIQSAMPVASPQSPDEPVYTADEMPTFQGGTLQDFRRWIMERIVYPKEAQEQNLQGKVMLRFVIQKDGTLANIEVLDSPSQTLSNEVVRVMKTSPKWTPGKIAGKPVAVCYHIPVEFTMARDDNTASNSAPEPKQVFRESVIITKELSQGERQPLIILDGKELPAATDINSIVAPDAIADIAILKDASARATYGDKGKNGVVIITTKAEAAKKKTTSEVIQVMGYGTVAKDAGATSISGTH